MRFSFPILLDFLSISFFVQNVNVAFRSKTNYTNALRQYLLYAYGRRYLLRRDAQHAEWLHQQHVYGNNIDHLYDATLTLWLARPVWVLQRTPHHVGHIEYANKSGIAMRDLEKICICHSSFIIIKKSLM
jgi:hypothetical protein